MDNPVKVTDDRQGIQDMLNALANQRNNAQNECVQLGAQLLAAQRRIAELEKQLADKEKPLPNGPHVEARAQA